MLALFVRFETVSLDMTRDLCFVSPDGVPDRSDAVPTVFDAAMVAKIHSRDPFSKETVLFY